MKPQTKYVTVEVRGGWTKRRRLRHFDLFLDDIAEACAKACEIPRDAILFLQADIARAPHAKSRRAIIVARLLLDPSASA